MPSARSCATLRCVAALLHICRFIAGATSSGQSRARHSVDSRSSAMPCASLAMKSAVAGATTIASASRESSMCPMALAAPESHRSVSTGLPESAWKVIGAMNCVAASVITTSTAMPSLTSSRVELGRLVGGDAAGDAEHDAASDRAAAGEVIASVSSMRTNGVLAWREFNMRWHHGTRGTRMRIADWPADERPRERLLKLGAAALVGRRAARDLSAHRHRGQERGRPGRRAARALRRPASAVRGDAWTNSPRCAGLGPAKYAQLQAVIEMARRALAEEIGERDAMTSPARGARTTCAVAGQLGRTKCSSRCFSTRRTA